MLKTKRTQICWHCKGHGVVTKMVWTGFGYKPVGWDRCSKCGGTGTRH